LISVLQRYTLQQCLPENFCETHLDFFASEKATLQTLPLCYFNDQPPKKYILIWKNKELISNTLQRDMQLTY